MDKPALCKKIRDCTYCIAIIYKGEMISTGSGVCYRTDRWLLTAAHVIDPKLSLDAAYLKDPSLKIYAKAASSKRWGEYCQVLVGYSIHLPAYMKRPLVVDLAILRPTIEVRDSHFLSCAIVPSPIGTDVLLAGFPDEMRLPFDFDTLLNYRHPDMTAKKRVQLELSKNQLLIKSGMIGCVHSITLEDSEKAFKAQGEIYWIDNASHYGASGGPVVGMDGSVIGIICQRGDTSAGSSDIPELRVPSGSSLALSPRLVDRFLRCNCT